MIVGIFLVVLLTLFSGKNIQEREQEIIDINMCSNFSLKKIAYCLRDYQATFYNYMVRPDTTKTLEDIKENGGDCYDYNKLYEKWGEELGFNSYSFRINSENKAHRFAIIMDDTGYCKLDMLHEPDCFIFVIGDKDE